MCAQELLDKHWSRFQAVAESDFLAVPDEAQLGDEIFDVVETEEGKILSDEMEIEPCQADVTRLTHRLYMVSNSGRPFFDRSEPGGGGRRKRRSLKKKKKKEMRKMHTENKAQCKNVEEIYNAAALELLQLQEMRKVEKEEKAMMTSPMHAKLVLKLQKECNKLEHRLKALNTVEKSYEEERVKESQETLVTRSVTLEEVRRDLEGWKEALGAEYKSLIDHGAIRPLIEEECQQVKGVNDEVITIPGMLVASVVPPCSGISHQAGSFGRRLDSIVTRSLIALASRQKWPVATADVKTAFL